MLALSAARAAPEDALSPGARRLYTAAVEADADGDPRTAESGYRAVLRAESDFQPAVLGLARSLVEQQHPEEALEVLERLPFDADAVEARGRILLSVERHEEASRAFIRLERLSPESSEVLLLQAEALAPLRPEQARERLMAWSEHPGVSGLDAAGARVGVAVADALRELEEGGGRQLLDSLAALAGAEEHELLMERRDRYDVEDAARRLAAGGSVDLPPEAQQELDRARSAFARGEVAAAHKALAPLVRRHPNSADLLGTWAVVSAQRGSISEAERAWRAAMALEPLEAGHPAALGRLVLEQYGGRHAGDAADLLEQAVRLRPGSAELWATLGDARWAEGELERAASAYKQALDRGSGSFDERARARLELSPAREEMPEPPALTPTDLALPLGYWVARVYAAEGRTTEALDELAIARAEGMEGPEIDELQGSLALASGDPQAETLYRRALAARPSEPRLLVALGDVLLLQGREEEALELLQRAAALPGGGRAWLPLARHHADAGELWEAERDLDRFFAGATGGPAYAEALALREQIDKRQRQIQIAGGLGVGGLLMAPPVVLWMRRRGMAVEALLARAPESFRDLAPLLSSLRHEVLKHNTSLLEPVADALEAGDQELVAWASDRLYGEEGVVARFREHAERIEAIGPRHGAVLNLRRVDPLFGPALAAIDRLQAAQRDVDRGALRAASVLREVGQVLNATTYRGLGHLLQRGQVVQISDELVARAWDAVQAEPARRMEAAQPLGLDLHASLEVTGSHADLHDVLANLFRNALAAGAQRVAVRSAIEEDWITGLERVVLKIADDAPGSVTTAQIRSRFIDRGLGLVVDLVHRFGGSVAVVEEPGFVKAIAVTLPRAEPLEEP